MLLVQYYGNMLSSTECIILRFVRQTLKSRSTILTVHHKLLLYWYTSTIPLCANDISSYFKIFIYQVKIILYYSFNIRHFIAQLCQKGAFSSYYERHHQKITVHQTSYALQICELNFNIHARVQYFPVAGIWFPQSPIHK